jgi:hypothetical protein
MNAFQAALTIQRAWRDRWNDGCQHCGHSWCVGRIRGTIYCSDPYLHTEW